MLWLSKMNLLKRAILSILGRPSKSIILLITIFILGNVLAGAYLISSSTVNLENNIKSRIGSIVTIRYSFDDPEGNGQNQKSEDANLLYSKITSILDEAKSLDHVENVDYRTWANLNFFDTLDINTSEYCDATAIGEKCHSVTYGGAGSSDFYELKNKSIILKEGRTFSAEEINDGASVIMIPDTLNAFKVGDKITYQALAAQIYYGDEGKTYTEEFERTAKDLEVIGIFEKKDIIEKHNALTKSINLKSHVFMPSQLINNVRLDLEKSYFLEKPDSIHDLYIYTGIIGLDRVGLYVDSVDSIDSVSNELKQIISQKGLSSELTVESSLSDFAKIMGPVYNLNSLGNIILYSSIVASVIIIGLLVLLSLRERKHELGVFMALGETGYKVVGQVLIEVLLIALISISGSMFSGHKIAQIMSDQMVQLQNVSDKELGTYLGSEFSQQDVIDEYKVVISTTDARDIYLITLFSVALSTIIPTIYIIRLNPKKILM